MGHPSISSTDVVQPDSVLTHSLQPCSDRYSNRDISLLNRSTETSLESPHYCGKCFKRTSIQDRYRRSNVEVTVKHLDQVRFSIQAREHSIVSDQPFDNGGNDTGMTPPELLLASVASCAAFYALQYLKIHNLATEGVEVKVTAEKLKPPARLGNFRVLVTSPVALTEEQTTGLTRSVQQCLIHNTLLNPPDIAIELTVKQEQLIS
jgi:putative redox protein